MKMKRRDFYKAFGALLAGIGAAASTLVVEKKMSFPKHGVNSWQSIDRYPTIERHSNGLLGKDLQYRKGYRVMVDPVPVKQPDGTHHYVSMMLEEVEDGVWKRVPL